MNTFAQRFKYLRDRKGWTQEDVAEKLGLSRSTIAGYESEEKNRIPREETLLKIADLLETTTDYLLGRTDNPEPTFAVVDFFQQLHKQNEEVLKKELQSISRRLYEYFKNRSDEIKKAAEYAEVNEEYLLKLINSTVDRYEINTIHYLSEYMNVTHDYLLGRTNDPSEEVNRNKTILSERLTKLRKEKGISKKDIVKRINSSNVTISIYTSWEYGSKKPDEMFLIKLADILETTTDYLLGRTDNPKPIEHEDTPISIAFSHGGEGLTEDELEHLEQELKRYRELKARFMREKNRD